MPRTALYDLHVRLGAKMVDFAGWDMPVLYSGIIAEHLATRNSCTMFDVSHMGRIYLSGGDAETLLERLCTRRISAMEPGQARYSHMCKQDGGILDDIIVSRFEDKWLVVCNASNREKIVGWLRQHAEGKSVQLQDETTSTVMLAVQGPDTADLADDMLPFDVSDIKRYRFKAGKYMGIDYVCSRTGYTGEDGFEIIVSSATGKMLAASLCESREGSESRVKPAGLGARDTLRLEAGMPLYGHELTEDIDSLTAGQGWCVDLEKDFVGCEAMRSIKEAGPKKKLVGLEVEGKRIARQDAPIERDGRQVGIVTSGTMSPTFQKVIAMAYVESECSEVGTELDANIRGKISKAKIVPLPFYKRAKK